MPISQASQRIVETNQMSSPDAIPIDKNVIQFPVGDIPSSSMQQSRVTNDGSPDGTCIRWATCATN